MKESWRSIVGDVPGICDSWVFFYSSLFSSCPTNIDVQNRLLQYIFPVVPPSQVHRCEGHLTVDEVHKALLAWPKGSHRARTASCLNSTWCFGISWVPILLRFWLLRLTPFSFPLPSVPLSSPSFLKRVEAAENCLSSWRSRSLSYSGKALVINAPALSRILYVASLVHMPS